MNNVSMTLNASGGQAFSSVLFFLSVHLREYNHFLASSYSSYVHTNTLLGTQEKKTKKARRKCHVSTFT